MNRLARLTLLAYPRAFRRGFGRDYLQTVADLRTHGGLSRARVAGRLVGEAVTVALAMRWEYLMRPTRTVLIVTAAIITLAGLVVGSEAIALVVVGIVALLALGFAGRDRPIAPSDPSVTRRWYWWFAGAAGSFLIGLAVLAVAQEDGGLSEPAWAAWMLSWATATVLAIIGVALGSARLVIAHRP